VDTVDAEWLQTPLRILSYTDPVYPQEALNAGQNGQVQIQVLITPEGRIGKVLKVDGPQVFSDAALEAVQGAEVTPPKDVYGQPVVVCATMVVSFQAIEGGVAWLQLRTR